MRVREEWRAFAVAAPGLEPIVADELRALGIGHTEVTDGGVEFVADDAFLYAANLHLRAASRVLVRLAEFRAASFADLERRLRRVPWERILPSGPAVSLRVTCRKSRLYHSGAVAERIMRDLTSRFQAVASVRGSPADDDTTADDAQLIVVRFDRDHCTISADSSGAHLHQRGYRTAVTGAPMRETLAAAVVLASGWDRASPLMDPFCGSGTIPIEAAMMAARIAPGRSRSFRFMAWPGFAEAAWQAACAKARKSELASPSVSIVGSDRSAAAIRAAEANAERAGVAELVRFERCDVRRLVPPPGGPGWLVTNPPYGVRLGGRSESQRLLTEFAGVVQASFGGWRLAMLLTRSAERISSLSFEEVLRTTNGGLNVRLVRAHIPH